MSFHLQSNHCALLTLGQFLWDSGLHVRLQVALSRLPSTDFSHDRRFKVSGSV